MAKVHKTALVPYSASAMYELVEDVDSYPGFLPGCRAVKVLERTDEEVKASIEMAKGPMHRWFTTRNRLFPQERMELSLIEGPFSHLEGIWHFNPLGDQGSKITMDIEFGYASRLVERTVGGLFNGMINHLVDAFVEEAHRRYGGR
ncbi:MAG: type II toxin-antitoxin system RatA family toxin [Gammaproteobacteria bacterium]|nr:type II toxin-antitoxin system RatA family toxin [Gammaproteobacteria bacterium]